MKHNDRTYTPDSWHIIEIKGLEKETFYKVLASWYGGFAGSNSWKLSSGVESCTSETNENGSIVYTLPQSSGSTYVLHDGAEHMSGLMGGMLHGFQKQVAEMEGTSLKVVTIQEMIEALKA